MKRYLLLVIAFVCVSIGAWAGPLEGFEMKKEDIGRWYFQSEPTAMDKVIKVEVLETGGLEKALQELTAILSGSTDKPHYAEFRAKLDETGVIQDDVNGPHTFNDFIANNKLILKVVYKKEDNAPETLTLSDDDITALNAINITTIDLQDLKPASVFTLDNDNVKNLILPNGWTKAEVVNAASSCGNLNAALSIGSTTVSLTQNGNTTSSDAATVMAYVNTPGTLYESTARLGYEGNMNTNVGINGGGVGPYGFSLANVKIAEIAGHVSARDYAGGTTKINFAANGHFVFDKEADENSSAQFAAIGGGTRSLTGTPQYGALNNASLVELDLGDAIIEEVNNADLTLSMAGTLGENTQKVVLPTYSGLKTIPADCLNYNTRVRDICIPGNFEYIKTRAFNSNGNNSRIAYIWTTGTDTDVKYDNGAVFTAGGDFICHDEEGYERNGCLYGTFTLPPNLKLIERFAFGSSITVHDVYVLNETAPECHVDAFSSDMYVGNNTYNSSSIVDGIITRDAYIQGDASSYRFTTMLHYPRETGTPNTQRYTDPSREYSIATGERDGNGNMIYFPNQSEFVYAYLQGSYGYTWKGWNDARNWYDNELTLGFGSDFRLDSPAHSAEAADGQALANQFWKKNSSTMLDDGHLEKYDRTFYDVTLGDNNQFNEVNAPSTNPNELLPYYEVTRRDIQLYPQAEMVGITDGNGDPVMLTVPDLDENGKPQYDLDNTNGTFVEDVMQDYIERENGQYCLGYVAVDQAFFEANPDLVYYERIDDYKADPNGGYYYVNGSYMTIEEVENGNYDWWWNQGNPKTTYRKETTYKQWSYNYYYYKGLYIQDYVEWTSAAGDVTRYDLEDVTYYRAATTEELADATVDKYSERMKQVQEMKTTTAYDYRGWHQFVLTAVAHNSTEEFEPLRSFITDNDWWTLCAPYDMRYNDVVKFFGFDRQGFDKKIPYLSKLMYVIRDVEHQNITLMFSKNLMEYKEQFRDQDTQSGKSKADRVHGYIDDETKWTPEEIAANPVILHAGVPYMIRPNLTVDAETGNINATRQFDIYKSENEDLYNRLKAAQEQGGTYQKNLIYNGMYTVPAYVVGTSSTVTEGTTNSRELEMKDGSKFTYTSGTINYRGQEVEYSISTDYTYTFVGTFYKSLMPQYCYFLGWDSDKNKAAFWYSRVQDKTGWNWNNETGVICPNFNTDLEISTATSLADPARWKVNATQQENDQTNIKCDDFTVGAQASNVKQYTMDYGADMNLAPEDENPLAEDFGDQEVLSIDEIQSLDVKGEWYNVNGQKLSGKPTQSGVYIMGNKKYVVK